MTTMIRRLAARSVAFLAAAPLFAHDFWIEPASFHPKQDALLAVGLRVGDFGRGDGVPRSEERIVQFVCSGPRGVKPIVGRDGGVPAGYVRLESEGLHVLGYRSNHTEVELPPDKFEAYLRERGLERVLKLREERGESARPGREIYARCSKALVCVGNGATSADDRLLGQMLGFTLEIIPEKNPFTLRAASSGSGFESLPLKLYFDGKPLEGALIGALCLDDPAVEGVVTPRTDPTVHARTDAEGRASLDLPRRGRWMLAAVHMVRAEANARADWESYWASLTFEVPGAP